MKSCRNGTLKELIEEYGPLYQVLFAKGAFSYKNAVPDSFVQSFPALGCGFSALGDWPERLQFDFSLVTSAFKGTKKAKTENTFSPNRGAVE